MSETGKNECAWLEAEGATPVPIETSLSIGRAASNALSLNTEGISRCHAMIHAQAGAGYWLVDLGSRNGTWLNDHRIQQPERLKDGDRIAILKHHFTFRAGNSQPVAITAALTAAIQQTRELPFWMLIVDIENFTGLSQQLQGNELAGFVARWLSECQIAIESGGGRINKYLGDGFFAVWPDKAGLEEKIADALRTLMTIEARGQPTFRMVVHRAIVSFGSSPLLAEESFIGKDVNFTFRMEKLAGSLGQKVLFSEAAAEKLEALFRLKRFDAQQVKGFDAHYSVFGLEGADSPPNA